MTGVGRSRVVSLAIAQTWVSDMGSHGGFDPSRYYIEKRQGVNESFDGKPLY